MMKYLWLLLISIAASGCQYTINGNPDVDLTAVGSSITTAVIPANGTLRLYGYVRNSSSDSTLTWSIVNGGIGSLTSTGTSTIYQAPPILTAPATITLRATSNQNPAVFAECLVTILNSNPLDTVTAGAVGLSVSPISVSLARGQSQQFLTTTIDASDTTVVWSIVNGPGTITTSGIYTAPLAKSTTSVAILQARSHADTNVISYATVSLVAGSDSAICFTNVILPILNNNCGGSGCHSDGGGRGGFATGSYEGVIGDIKPGDARGSRLYTAITQLNANNRMPPLPQQALSQTQVKLIGEWIDQGAANTDCK